MPVSEPTTVITVDEVLHETDLAWLVLIDGEKYWLPKSKVEDDELVVGATGIDIEVPEWLAAAKGLT